MANLGIWSGGDLNNAPEGKAPTFAIGTPFMQVLWTDPDFDPEQRAFYYVRVIEIPTPRWTGVVSTGLP